MNSPTSPTDPNTPDTPSAPVDPSKCTYVLNKYITVPTRLENTPADCDYLLEGLLRVNSTLTIEPGVVIVASQDAKLTVDGGQIQAIGTAQNRIVLEGVSHVLGYWEGIRFVEGRESHFDYVDIKDAGQPCGSSARCPEGGLVTRDVTFSFTNSSVSNSYVHGLNLGGTVMAFSNNRFYGNARAGVKTSASLTSVLDENSDYLGSNAPNGEPYIFVTGGGLTEDPNREWRWRKLNADYLVGSNEDGSVDLFGGKVIFEPGVKLVFAKSAVLRLRNGASLSAIGSAAAPIVFTSKEERPGYWKGLELWDTRQSENELNFVHISYGGVDGGLYLKDDSYLKLSNTKFAYNKGYGVSCSPYSDFNTVQLGEGNSFTGNGGDGVSTNCVVNP